MPRSLAFLLALATLSATAATSSAQTSDPVVPANSYMQFQAAPIEHNYARTRSAPAPRITSSEPIPGVLFRYAPGSAVQTVSATSDRTELRVDRGLANVSVHQPESNTQILVDLPGGQTALLKDGLYTFNADTNTVRVLKGEADAFPGNGDTSIKVKEDRQFTFGRSAHAEDTSLSQTRSDLLPGPAAQSDRRYSEGSYNDGPVYGYPYYPGFYPYPYGGFYPYGYGLSFGFGYYGGYRGGFGGYRGGFYGHR